MSKPAPGKIFLAATLLSVFACTESAYIEPPPPTVKVATPERRDVTDYLEVTGTAESVEEVEIRARVEGFLMKTHFTEGEYVEEGDLLYEIDPREYQARVEQARASLVTAKASLGLQKATLSRLQQAQRSGAVSEIEVIESRAKVDVARADVHSAEASLLRAELDLSYTTIYAPTTGRAGHSEVDDGNLVGAGEKTLLTTIVQYDPIYIYFSFSERQIQRLARMAREAVMDGEREGEGFIGSYVEAGRSADEGYPFKGAIDFRDQGIDSATGTFRLRAVFPNPEPVELVPGLFMRARVPIRKRQGSLLVSERALGADQGGRYVLVVGEDDVVEHRPVKVGALVEGMRVIDKGLEPDDRVITQGVLFARPGAVVQPELVPATPIAATADDEGGA